jgi:hypothetical protein
LRDNENLPDWFLFPRQEKKVAPGGYDEKNNEVEVDKDNFAKVTRSKGRKVQDEPSFTGRLRAFPDDPVPSDDEPYANDEASGSDPKDNSAPEGQLSDQWWWTYPNPPYFFVVVWKFFTLMLSFERSLPWYYRDKPGPCMYNSPYLPHARPRSSWLW